MPTSLGTIPSDFSITAVYETPSMASLPALVYGMRPSFRELIWDAEGGFTDDWRDRSSVTGSGPYVFYLSRRAFSAASMAIYASDAVAGGGATGSAGGDLSGTYPNPSVAKVGGIAVSGTPTTGQVLTASSSSAAAWSTPGAGAGDVVGPGSAVAARIATFNGTTGKLIQDGGKTLADIATDYAAAIAARSAICYHGYSTTSVTAPAGTTFVDLSTMLTITDSITAGISRSGATFTFPTAGKYRLSCLVNYSGSTGDMMVRFRDTVGNTTLLNRIHFYTDPTIELHGIFAVTAGQTATLQFCRSTSGGTYGTNTLNSEVGRNANISIEFIGG